MYIRKDADIADAAENEYAAAADDDDAATADGNMDYVAEDEYADKDKNCKFLKLEKGFLNLTICTLEKNADVADAAENEYAAAAAADDDDDAATADGNMDDVAEDKYADKAN